MAITYSRFHASALLRVGKNDDAVTYLEARLRLDPTRHAAWHQLSVAESQRRRYVPAERAAKRALALAPNELLYQRQYGFTLGNLGRSEEAIAVLLPVMQHFANDYLMLSALQLAYYRTQKFTHALALGRKLLKLDDSAPVVPVRDAASVDIMPISRGEARIISFSLCDNAPAANVGAIANARLVQPLYPGWKCRFYLGKIVPSATRMHLAQAGAEIIDADQQYPSVPPSMWHWLVADDFNVGAFMCRDSRARLSPKDAAAVDAWLHSGKHAHVMRDHIQHHDLILPGLWGARCDDGRLLHMAERIKRFLSTGAPQGAERKFLAKEIWPAIRDDCLIHDSNYPLFNAQPFPAKGKRNDQFHVGMGITDAAALRTEAQALGLPWPLA